MNKGISNSHVNYQFQAIALECFYEPSTYDSLIFQFCNVLMTA